MAPNELISEVSRELGLALKEKPDKQLLADKINELIVEDFPRLVSILYRVDISEEKLKLLLKDNPDKNAGVLIADMMIDRQAQKIKSRKESGSITEIPDDEKW